MRGPAGDESSADLTGGRKLSASKRPSSRNGVTWTTVGGRFRLEEWQNPLRAVGRPRRDPATIGFAERLR